MTSEVKPLTIGLDTEIMVEKDIAKNINDCWLHFEIYVGSARDAFSYVIFYNWQLE